MNLTMSFILTSIFFHWNTFLNHVGRSTLVGQRPMKSLSSVCPSVHPSLSFLKIGSLVLSDIVHDDSWPWYLVTNEARFLKKKLAARIWGEWGKMEPKIRVFCHFLKIGSFVFLEIVYNDSLQQCLTSSRSKIHKKIFWSPNLSQRGENQAWN